VEDNGRLSGGLPFDADARVTDRKRDVVSLEVSSERGSGLRFFVAKERTSGFDHCDLRSESRKGLTELSANGAAAKDRQ
jgi:hypothetical protein